MNISNLSFTLNNKSTVQVKQKATKTPSDTIKKEELESSDSQTGEEVGVVYTKSEPINPIFLASDEDEQVAQKKLAEVSEKLKSGVELTDKELNLLRTRSPILYKIAMESKIIRKAFEEQLKNCRSKEEADDLKLGLDLGYAKKIKQAHDAGNYEQEFRQTTFKNTIDDEYEKFRKTDKYKMLPAKHKEEN